jgi:para-aminobenzoate synthetase component 1
MLSWASPFNIFCFLDNHNYHLPGHSIECMLAAGAVRSIRLAAGNAFRELKDFATGERDWMFGHFAYDLAKETEPPRRSRSACTPRAGTGLSADHPDHIGFPDLFFFVPEVILELSPDQVRIGSLNDDHQSILDQILRISPGPSTEVYPVNQVPWSLPALQPRFSPEEYLTAVRNIQSHILRGDCYEVNFCQEFYACPARIDPLKTWFSLSEASPNPCAAFYRLDDCYLLCASPERYLKRTGNTLISQPIKGTSPRFQGDPGKDRSSRDQLYHSSKDRAENVMVVDLMRNDLSKICLPGSVCVEELYGIYSFPQVHQMISTVKGELPPGANWVDAIRATFPMGSMTGAPKNRVVELIEQVERTRRGLFAGAVGYVEPEGDFDFNVVIRSLLYDQAGNYLSYLVGSGITWYSDPQLEYEECIWKAEGMQKALASARIAIAGQPK